MALVGIDGKPINVYDAKANKILQTAGIGIRDGLIKTVGNVSEDSGLDVVYVQENQIVLPEITDLHVHLANIFWSRYMDPDKHCHARGTGRAVDAGSTGAINFEGFRKLVIDDPRIRAHVLAFLNIMPGGLILPNGEAREMYRFADLPETIRIAKENQDVIVGMKVRIGSNECRENWKKVLSDAKNVGEKIGKPIMVHVSDGPPPLEEVLKMLRQGDIVTHCYHGKEPHDQMTILRDKKLMKAVINARKRGILFDVGHGGGSFDWNVVFAAVSLGFDPDTISSDLHDFSQHNAKSLLHVMSKMHHVGIAMNDVFGMVTANAAEAIGFPRNSAHIAPGKPANMVVINVLESETGFPGLDGAVGSTQPSVQRMKKLFTKGTMITEGVVW